MSGYRADPEAIRSAGRMLEDTVESVAAALADLDPGRCADLGPGRLGPAAAALTEQTRADLDRALGAVTADVTVLRSAGTAYAEQERRAADRLSGPG
ncbi:hypothetical protein [Actinophytocola sp.]|uniref:WXG100 family type VII secretion target n=1 Tax=Actinophytocola sp. TaxID=1872138 RepID=UPI002D7EA33B|nr:hypothetical protein [Actinophytocola sp.]HET9138695.1 hypothetical protein [Actinophytocola sp.]